MQEHDAVIMWAGSVSLFLKLLLSFSHWCKDHESQGQLEHCEVSVLRLISALQKGTGTVRFEIKAAI